jgi:hypothetical protein
METFNIKIKFAMSHLAGQSKKRAVFFNFQSYKKNSVSDVSKNTIS